MRSAATVAALMTGLVIASPFTSEAQAGADVAGDCRASVGNVDLAGRSASDPGDAIEVGATERVPLQVDGVTGGSTFEAGVEVAGLRHVFAAGDVEDGAWRHELDVADGSWATAGLVKVVLVTEGPGPACIATALLDVDGSPVSTVAGGASIAACIVGFALVVWATVRSARRRVRAVGLL